MSDAAVTASLRRHVGRGLAWKAASSLVLQVVRIAVGVTLARLLSPHDYGIAGMVIVFSSLVLIFSDLAFGSALIQRDNLTEDDKSTVFWTSVAGGLVFTLVGFACARPLAAFYGEPKVESLFMAMSVSFFIASIASTQAALLTREMNFRSLELRQMGASVLSGGVGITIAALGYGPWAIIAQQVAFAVGSTALLWVASPWRPRLRFSFASLRGLASYSGNIFGSRLLFYANRNADNMLVGRFLGPSALGAYSVAYNIMLMPISQIATPVQDVLFPAFSRLQNNIVALREAWLRANTVIASITIPTLLGLIAVTPDFVHVVLGSRWSSAAPVIRILAWVGLLQSIQGMNSSVLRAVDRTKVLFRYSVIVLVSSLTAFVGGLHWGIVGVAAAYAISSSVVEPYYSWVTARAVGLSLLDFVRPLRGVVEAAVAMCLTVLGARQLLIQLGLATTPRLLVEIAIGIAVYVPTCAWRAGAVRLEVREVVARRRRLRSAPPPQPVHT